MCWQITSVLSSRAMKHYVIVEIDITDPSWIPDYAQHVTRMIEQHGGRYLARTPNLEKLEGKRERPQMCVLIEWPSKESAVAFYNSADYKPYLERRLAGAKSELMLVAGEDVVRAG